MPTSCTVIITEQFRLMWRPFVRKDAEGCTPRGSRRTGLLGVLRPRARVSNLLRVEGISAEVSANCSVNVKQCSLNCTNAPGAEFRQIMRIWMWCKPVLRPFCGHPFLYSHHIIRNAHRKLLSRCRRIWASPPHPVLILEAQ